MTLHRPRKRVPWWPVALALAAFAAVVPVRGAAEVTPLLNLREGAADARTAARIVTVNERWAAEHPGQVPCRKCEIRPPGSDLVWTYYRRQGFFPNWVRAARDLLRRDRAGEVAGFRAGVDEVVSFSARRTSPQGVTYRINESPYLSTDSTRPPWRDAMGQGLILTLFVPTLPDNPTAAESNRVRSLAEEYLNSFAVHWRDGGVAANGSAGGRWYLEYATPRGERARVLNGFMQTLVSMDRFATQADALADDPRWAALAARARENVRLGALELDAHLDDYDLGNGLSKYSIAKPDPAPPVYQTYHRQLLLRLQDVPYLPADWRRHFSEMRVRWGGEPDEDGVAWWLVGGGVLLLAAAGAALGWRVAARRRGSRPDPVAVPPGQRPEADTC